MLMEMHLPLMVSYQLRVQLVLGYNRISTASFQRTIRAVNL